MSLIRAVLALLAKTFAADLGLTLTALAAVGLSSLALRAHILTPGQAPVAVTLGVLAALTIGVARGAKR